MDFCRKLCWKRLAYGMEWDALASYLQESSFLKRWITGWRFFQTLQHSENNLEIITLWMVSQQNPTPSPYDPHILTCNDYLHACCRLTRLNDVVWISFWNFLDCQSFGLSSLYLFTKNLVIVLWRCITDGFCASSL